MALQGLEIGKIPPQLIINIPIFSILPGSEPDPSFLLLELIIPVYIKVDSPAE